MKPFILIWNNVIYFKSTFAHYIELYFKENKYKMEKNFLYSSLRWLEIIWDSSLVLKKILKIGQNEKSPLLQFHPDETPEKQIQTYHHYFPYANFLLYAIFHA